MGITTFLLCVYREHELGVSGVVLLSGMNVKHIGSLSGMDIIRGNGKNIHEELKILQP